MDAADDEEEEEEADDEDDDDADDDEDAVGAVFFFAAPAGFFAFLSTNNTRSKLTGSTFTIGHSPSSVGGVCENQYFFELPFTAHSTPG